MWPGGRGCARDDGGRGGRGLGGARWIGGWPVACQSEAAWGLRGARERSAVLHRHRGDGGFRLVASCGYSCALYLASAT